MLALGGGDTTWLDMCARQRQVGEFANEAAVVALAEVYKLTQLKALHVPTLRHVRTARQLLQHHMAGQLLLNSYCIQSCSRDAIPAIPAIPDSSSLCSTT